MPQLTQVYSPRPGAVYVPAAATYDASARYDGHAMPVVPVSIKNVRFKMKLLNFDFGNSVFRNIIVKKDSK